MVVLVDFVLDVDCGLLDWFFLNFPPPIRGREDFVFEGFLLEIGGTKSSWGTFGHYFVVVVLFLACRSPKGCS